jgi:dTDP-glucose 4,6-dehydratase
MSLRLRPNLGRQWDNPLHDDLDHILAQTEGLWEELRGQRIFVTGGTGFFGTWLLESFLWANDRLDLKASAVVLTRDPDAFRRNVPNVALHPAIRCHAGDVRSFAFPAGEFSHVVHAGATSAASAYGDDPLSKFDTVAGGTRHTLDFAVHCKAAKWLLTGSGAVYGRQPSGMTHIPEDYCGAPDPTEAAHGATWGISKRAAEHLCVLYARKHGFEAKIARCFSFIGPYLPLDIHYAAGNFIRDALRGGPIRVEGDGSAYRSYLYTADLAFWLWTILFRGENCRAYNVGSEEHVTIAQLAQMVAQCAPTDVDVTIAQAAQPGKREDWYVPSTQRVAKELGLRPVIGLADAIGRTMAHHRS